jgi:hypothetical protein
MHGPFPEIKAMGRHPDLVDMIIHLLPAHDVSK